ncbi:hypothetical protein [Prolixibacter sp. NT017]|uniref:hypothetical protein n=1 Tax=Prolixibacter sp. NT017 TaxID=2652390 RepID=UPI00126B9E84|nr:hypothetical protein [Prolixibacter sp. NT017]GET25304.1 hypothetical protein NT017_16330 [Prolixibacter sp. NT017]
MKPYVKLIVTYFFVLLGMFLLLRLLAVWLLGRPMDAPVLVTGIVWIILFSLIYWGVLIREFKPRLDYIQSPGTQPPVFKATVTKEVEISNNSFSFQKLHKELVRFYEVTYVDEGERIMKLRDRFSMSSWGACTFIHYQENEGILLLASYPMSNRTMKQGGAGRKQNESIALLIRDMNL